VPLARPNPGDVDPDPEPNPSYPSTPTDTQVREVVSLVDSGPGVTPYGRDSSLAATLPKGVDAVVLVLDATCFSSDSAGRVAGWLREAMKAVGSAGLFVVWNKCDLLDDNLAPGQVGACVVYLCVCVLVGACGWV